LLNNYNNRAAHAKGVIGDLPIKNEFQAGVIATLHFKIASRLFRLDAQLDGKRFIVRADPDRAGDGRVFEAVRATVRESRRDARAPPSEQQYSPIELDENSLQLPKAVQERGQSTLQPKMRSQP
jgi:hypothetical protein